MSKVKASLSLLAAAEAQLDVLHPLVNAGRHL